MTKAIIISVGGSPEPVIYCLNKQQPQYIIYFTSSDSREQVRQNIEPQLNFKPKDHDFIVTPNYEDLLVSIKEIMRRLPKLLDLWGLDPADLAVDYTGGSKTMSAALVLTLVNSECKGFSYVGGTARDKQGLGVVIKGREKILCIANPWDALAVKDLHDITLLFKQCRFPLARERALEVAGRIEAQKPFFQHLASAIEGYDLWDNFNYKEAVKKLGRARGFFTSLAPCAPVYQPFAQSLVQNHEQLQQINQHYQAYTSDSPQHRASELDGSWLIKDLIANAVRRGDVEHKYHDAVVRLYSALEKSAKLRLLHSHGIDNSNADLQGLPDVDLRTDLERTCRNPEGKIQIGLFKSFQLLQVLGDPLGDSFQKQTDNMRKIMDVRNHCILNHGYRAVRKETYQDFKKIVIDFADISEDQLPRFPHMDWQGAFL